jgi:hypothetical protein
MRVDQSVERSASSLGDLFDRGLLVISAIFGAVPAVVNGGGVIVIGGGGAHVKMMNVC